MVEMAALFGAQVAGLEASESKFDVIRQMGGVPVMSRSFDDIEPRLTSGTAPPDVVIDLLGSNESLTWALPSLPLGGRLVVLTTFRDVDVQVSPRDLVLREITVLGSRYASKAELRESARSCRHRQDPSRRVARRATGQTSKTCIAPCWRGRSSAAARWTGRCDVSGDVGRLGFEGPKEPQSSRRPAPFRHRSASPGFASLIHLYSGMPL